MSWGFLHWGMLAGLAGISIPVIIHFLNRRRATVVDWGAMQFLKLGRRSTWKLQLGELLLLLGRMALLALIALALSRPFWNPRSSEATAALTEQATGDTSGGRRDIVLVLDGSASMDRRPGRTTRSGAAAEWCKKLIAKLGPGDSVAVLLARDRVRRVIAPASFDMKKVEAELYNLPPPRGACNLPMAIADALRLLDGPGNPVRDVIVLTDGQRFAWRPDESALWTFVHEIHKQVAARSGVAPHISSVVFDAEMNVELANAAVGPIELSRGLITPNQQFTVATTISSGGPGPITRTVELWIDGQLAPGTKGVVGPIPAGGSIPLSFNASIDSSGSHVLAVRLTGSGDALPGDDESARAIEVTKSLQILLVDGEPATEPLSGETDFLRAALAPAGEEFRQVEARAIHASEFRALDLKDQRVLVLANVERLNSEQTAGIVQLLQAGGGVLVAPGDQVDAAFANSVLYQGGDGWLPARLGMHKGKAGNRSAIAHPAPRSFIGPALAPLGKGDSPPLAGADLFHYTVLEPAREASTLARLDTGDPWIVERRFGRGRVAILAGPIDAEGGTLPVNPDFVPWAHELIFRLANGNSADRNVLPDEPIVLDLNPAPGAEVTNVVVVLPDGSRREVAVTRDGDQARVQFNDTGDPGDYRFLFPASAGGQRYATVAADTRESNLERLGPDEHASLANGWPFRFEPSPGHLIARLFGPGTGSSGRREIWRYLVMATLAGLCLEIWLTRRLVKSRGFADFAALPDPHTLTVTQTPGSHA